MGWASRGNPIANPVCGRKSGELIDGEAHFGQQLIQAVDVQMPIHTLVPAAVLLDIRQCNHLRYKLVVAILVEPLTAIGRDCQSGVWKGASASLGTDTYQTGIGPGGGWIPMDCPPGYVMTGMTAPMEDYKYIRCKKLQ